MNTTNSVIVLAETTRLIYCCGCERNVRARLTDGREIYPGRKDLRNVPFWKCDNCFNHVGCQYKSTSEKTKPLGCIATKEIAKLRGQIHRKLDVLWREGRLRRDEVYRRLSKAIGYSYHTANIRSIDEAHRVIELLEELHQELNAI